ncbi:hypothetical protein FJZ19_06015 [Candidatus Pacearchaeota archaeon]|nr:hypothetical protein [Candidatus Pacearchaeota archaeon]
MKIKNKKAVFFTILVICLLFLFLVVYTSFSAISKREAINKRIETMNNFVFSMEKDLSRQLYISGYRAIFIFEKKIVEEGSYISDINSSFQELFFNGTLDGENQEIMNGAKFSDIQNSINHSANRINVAVSFSRYNVSISQIDPWRVRISFKTDIFISDMNNLVFWNKTETVDAYVPVEGFEDPIYTLNANGIIRKINHTNYVVFASGTDVSNLTNHVQSFYYLNSTLAPSFLDRLEGKTSPNEQGIESLAYLPELSSQGISIKSKSCVDYIYFSSSNPDSKNIQGMPLWFILDDAHLDIYQVRGLAV